MYHFHDVPQNRPKHAGLNAISLSDAEKKIYSAWQSHSADFPALGVTTASYFKAGTTKLAKGLFLDGRRKMPFAECKSLLDVYLVQQLGEIQCKKFVSDLPSHQKRIAAEFMSCAASISAAKRNGYQFFANRSDLNALIPDCWRERWEGDGPDLLMSGNKGCAFFEIKGSTNVNYLNFAKFASFKAQSVNAQLFPFGGVVNTRYLLSQVIAVPGSALKVHWFNADDADNAESRVEQTALIHIATALAQFVSQINNAGYDASKLLDGKFTLPIEARNGHGFFLAPESGGDFHIGVSYAALRLFVRISRFLLLLRVSDQHFEEKYWKKAMRLSRQVSNLRSFWGNPHSAWRRFDDKPIYTFATGIFLLGPRG